MSKKYEFEIDGKKFAIPSFTDLPIGVVRKARHGKDDADTAFLILEALMPEGSPELDAIDAMDAREFEQWLAGWTQGASVGES